MRTRTPGGTNAICWLRRLIGAITCPNDGSPESDLPGGAVQPLHQPSRTRPVEVSARGPGRAGMRPCASDPGGLSVAGVGNCTLLTAISSWDALRLVRREIG